MSLSNQCLPLSSSLPSLRSLCFATPSQLSTALHKLHAIYCPLRLPANLQKLKGAISPNADSGYTSRDEVEEENIRDNGDALSVIRLDEFDHSFARRWLTSLISRAEELPFEEEELSSIVDKACFILSSFNDTDSEDCGDALVRDFSFPLGLSSGPARTIDVQLKDALLSGVDHTDVGLQSWGAGIIFSGLICASPEPLGLTRLPSDASLIELGAGTGLVSLTLAKLFPYLQVTKPSLVATDYHPAVLHNLRANITMNFPLATADAMPVQTAALDWSAPPASLQSSVHMLFAADVIYAPEHAALIRDCTAHLLVPDGLLWLMVTVRSRGKFEGILDTAETAFKDGSCPPSADGRVLRILEREMLDKKRGIGRGDEDGYMLYKIGWTSN